jgi:hypothetical protein
MALKLEEVVAKYKLEIDVSDTKVIKDEDVSFKVSFDSDDIEMLNISWNFDDGTYSSEKDVLHSFDKSDDYNVSVTVIGSDSKTYTDSVAIKVLGSDTPTLSDANLSLFENAKSGDKVGLIPINFSGTTNILLSGKGSEKFVVKPDGYVYVAAGALFDYETEPGFSLIATSVNGPGVDVNVSVDVSVLNVDELEPTLANFSAVVAENSPVNTRVGTVRVISTGDSAIKSMKLSGTGSDNFDISSSGIISVSSTANLDYETIKSYSLSVTATNNAGESAPASVMISLSNVAETLPVINDFSANIKENYVGGDSIGSIKISSTGDTPILSITLSGDGNEDFTVDTSGLIKVAPSKNIDYERQNIYNLSAVATNTKGDSSSVKVDITVLNTPETKPEIEDFAVTLVENVMKNTVIGQINITQSGDTPISSITLSGTGASDFKVSVDGNISVACAYLDHERMSHYLLSVVAENAAGKSENKSVEITVKDAIAITTASIKADDASADDYFSNSISLDKDRVLSAAYKEDKGGAVYLYTKNVDESYTQDVKIAASDIKPEDGFGFDIGMDGDLIVVGAPFKDINDTYGADAGAVYLFKYFEVDKSALELVKLVSENNTTGDNFGKAVCISGDIVLVASPKENNATGAVYLYKYNSSDNSLTKKLRFISSSVSDGDEFGVEVKIDDNKIVVGTKAEAAYLFTYNDIDNTIEENYKFVSNTPQVGDEFGSQVDIRLDYLIIGSPGNDSAYLYRYNGNTISPNVKKIVVEKSGNGIKFGSDVAIDDNKVLIGAVDEDSVYLYKYNADTFNLEEPPKKFTITTAARGSEVGSEVELNGDLFAVSAPKEDSVANNSGALFIVNTEAQNRPYLINYKSKISVNENSIIVFTCVTNSVNGLPISYNLSGVDAAVFTIDTDGVIRANSLDFENPIDVGNDNIYNINIDIKDSAGMSYSYPLKIEVIDISD